MIRILQPNLYCNHPKWPPRAMSTEGHLVSLRLWPLTCDLKKCYFARSSLLMRYLEIWLRYMYSLPYWPWNLPPGPLTLKYDYRGRYSKSRWDFSDHVIRVKMMSFYIIFHLVFISYVKLKLSGAKHGFENSRKRFWFSTSDNISNRNRN